MASFGEKKRLAGLLTGPALFVVIALVPMGLETSVAGGLALAALCAAWWITEAIPPAVTALLPGILLPVMGLVDLKTALASYADPLIFLFLGGFLIAQAMRSSRLDRKIASVALAVSGTRPPLVLASFMGITAVISAFISNTATTAMMLPIGLAVLDSSGLKPGSRYGRTLLLGIAWAASIGGVATIVGTPPNVAFAGFASSLLDREVTFLLWMVIGVPFAALMLPAAWGLLLLRFRPEIRRVDPSASLTRTTLADPKPPATLMGRILVGVVFLMVTAMWFGHGLLKHLPWEWASRVGESMSDTTIALAGGLILFVVPASVSPFRPVLTWQEAKGIPWGVLLLFGGGLSLGNGLFECGAASWLADQLSFTGALPWPLLVASVSLLVLLLTEITSNTATANMIIPLLFALAPAIGVDPFLMAIPATLACSSAFMLPVATPPNAIVYGSGYIRMSDMITMGVLLNLVALGVIVLLAATIIGPVFAVAG